MATIHSDDLFPETRNPEGTQVINERCALRTKDGYRVVFVSGIPLAHYPVGDRMSEAYAMVNLIDQGWADQNDVARAFGYSARTARRYQRRFDEGGLAALGQPGGYPRGRARMTPIRRGLVQQLKAKGHSHHEIARRLGVSVRAIRKTLRRLGWKPTPVTQAELPLDSSTPTHSALSASVALAGITPPARPPEQEGDSNLSAFSATSAESLPTHSLDTDPSDRSGDRLMARLGLLNDAAPLFGCGTAIPRAGVLLALPALISGGVY